MNLIGKVLTVLIFVMSMMFLTFAIIVRSPHTNWRKIATNPDDPKAPGLKERIVQLNNAQKELVKEAKRIDDWIAREQASRRLMIAELSAKLDTIEKQLDALKIAYEEKLETHGRTVEELKTRQEALDGLAKVVDGLRIELRNARQGRDTEYRKLVEVTERVRGLAGQVTSLQAERDSRMDAIAKVTKTLRDNNVSLDDDIEKIPPKLDGIVRDVKDPFVEVSLGTDDGLKIGHEMDVVRTGRFVARIKIIKTDKNVSVGQVIPETVNGRVEKNDLVFTTIKKKT